MATTWSAFQLVGDGRFLKCAHVGAYTVPRSFDGVQGDVAAKLAS